MENIKKLLCETLNIDFIQAILSNPRTKEGIIVRVPVNSFAFHSCERTPQVEYLLRLLRHRSSYEPRHLVFIVYGVDYQGI